MTADTSDNKSGNEANSESNVEPNRALQIRITQLTTDVQISLSLIVSAITCIVAFSVFSYQLLLTDYPSMFTVNSFLGYFLIGVNVVLAGFARKWILRLNECREEIQALR
jgi:hypothetical protein